MRDRVKKLGIPKVSGELFDKFSPLEVSERPGPTDTTSQRLLHRRRVIQDARMRVS